MPKVTIDGFDYNTEDLSETGKAELESLQFLESKMSELRNKIQMLNIAKNAYLRELKNELEEIK